MVFVISRWYRTPAFLVGVYWLPVLIYLFSNNVFCSYAMCTEAAATHCYKCDAFRQQGRFSRSLEARSPRSASVSPNQGVGRDVLPLEVLEQSLFLPLQLLTAAGVLRLWLPHSGFYSLSHCPALLHLRRWERARRPVFFLEGIGGCIWGLPSSSRMKPLSSPSWPWQVQHRLQG